MPSPEEFFLGYYVYLIFISMAISLLCLFIIGWLNSSFISRMEILFAVVPSLIPFLQVFIPIIVMFVLVCYILENDKIYRFLMESVITFKKPETVEEKIKRLKKELGEMGITTY